LTAHLGSVLIGVETGEEMDDVSGQSNDGFNSGSFQHRFIENTRRMRLKLRPRSKPRPTAWWNVRLSLLVSTMFGTFRSPPKSATWPASLTIAMKLHHDALPWRCR